MTSHSKFETDRFEFFIRSVILTFCSDLHRHELFDALEGKDVKKRNAAQKCVDIIIQKHTFSVFVHMRNCDEEKLSRDYAEQFRVVTGDE